jgi:hypothetical protein
MVVAKLDDALRVVQDGTDIATNGFEDGLEEKDVDLCRGMTGIDRARNRLINQPLSLLKLPELPTCEGKIEKANASAGLPSRMQSSSALWPL